jgi:DNA-binding GntR family transcriptional regulator
MKQDSQAYVVFMEIRRQILSMQLVPNTRLTEDTWASHMNVSRMAVREALTRLLGEGLVQIGAKGGYFVTVMTPEDLRQIREVRELLELGAVRIGFSKITQVKIDELYSVCDDFMAFVTKGYLGGACEADIRFHEKLMMLAENPRLVKAYQYSQIPLFHQRIGKSKEYVSELRQSDAEHRLIVKALKDQNLALTEQTLLAHFARGEKVVTAFLEKA